MDDDLVAALRSRAEEAQEGQRRLARLLDAVVTVGSDLELREVLDRITRSACELVGARYGALGVLDHDGRGLAEFVTHGLTPAQRAALGEPPHGLGLLGLLIHEPRTRRVADIAHHPASYGVPQGHPPMTTFLGTPVRTRTAVFGNLYLADKQGGREFTAEDESVLEALASAAGVAVENARLYDLSRRRGRWAEAMRELGQALLADEEEDAALATLLEAVRAVAGAERVAVALVDDGRLVLRPVGDGLRTGGELTGPAWRPLREGRRPVHAGAPPDERLEEVAAVRAALGADPAGPAAGFPLSSAGPEVGVLLVAWSRDVRDPSATVGELVGVALETGVALVAGRARRDRARVSLLDDRARIARDMHDHVIQRLFATGLSLQAVSGLATHPTLRDRLEEAVGELDAAISEIRQAIFELHERRDQGLAAHLQRVVHGLGRGAGGGPGSAAAGTPRVDVDPAVEDLPQDLADDVVAVVREGVANAVRHAAADTVAATVEVHADGPDRTVVVVVEDDGVGVDPGRPRSGLANLADRATRRGGLLHVAPRSPAGTRLEWTVPVPTPRPGT